MIRSPLTALLDESRGIEEVLKDELKNLATSVLQMMYEDVITKPLMESIKAGVQPALAEVGNMIKDFLGGLIGGMAGGIGNVVGMGISSLFGGGGTATVAAPSMESFMGVIGEKGLISDRSFIKQCAKGDILSGPTLFPMSNGGIALGGEKGKEALMPLGRDNQGRLGVRTGENGETKQPIKIINVIDQSQFQEYLDTGDGERQVVNIMKRNASEIQEIVT